MRSIETGQIYDATKLARYFDILEMAIKQIECIENSHQRSLVLTARRIDEGQPAGARAYMKVSSSLNAGFDNVNAFKALMSTFGLTVWAPWTLIRAFFEAAFWALWILEPDDGLTRRTRGLRLAVIDQKEWKNWANAVGSGSASARMAVDQKNVSTESVYRSEAARLQVDWSRLRQNVNVVDEIKALKCIKTLGVGPNFFEAVWRSLSGAQHGYVYALLANSDHDIGIPVPGGRRVQVTVKDEMLDVCAMMSMWLFWEAANLYIRRTTSM